MSKKLYLASMYSRREEMAGIADQLEALGYEITARWVYGLEEKAGITHEEIAIMDLIDVRDADTVVSFTHERDTLLPAGGGRHVEFGFAVALDKELILIGPKENVFHYFPEVEQFDTLEDWLVHERMNNAN